MGQTTRRLMMGAAGAADESTFVDDVFSTYLYKGNNSTQTITNGIDLDGEGGMVWIKDRDQAAFHSVSTKGVGNLNQFLVPDENYAFITAGNNVIDQYNSNGFNLNIGSGLVNANNVDYTSWTFRKAPGFFDVVTFTETGSNLPVSHELGCIPGMILMKRTNGTSSWFVFHRDMGQDKLLRLDRDIPATDMSGSTYGGGGWCPVTNTTFTFKSGAIGYGAGSEWVAYLFAGGASDEPGSARSVDFDGSGDYLSIPVNNSDFDWAANGSLTIEAFVNMDAITGQTYNSIINRWNGSGKYSFGFDVKSNGNLFFYRGNGSTITTHESSGVTINIGQWYHIAVVKDGTTGRFFINGQACGTFNWNEAFTNSTNIPLHIGNLSDGNNYAINGHISNVRFVNGTALYTSSFRPPTEPLTNITNTKLLCCNNSSTTGSTVTPGTITANGNPTASTDSPFDDPEGFKFGKGGDQNIIKTGSYTGNGDTSNGTKVYLGFEPQWLLIKSTGFTEHWHQFDVMRGIVNGGNDLRLEVNQTGAEYTLADFVTIDSDGFTVFFNPNVNGNNENFAYIAIRRPDGYVGKPPEAGTDAFAMDTGNGSSTIPAYDSTFPVDFAFARRFAATDPWYTSSRLMTGKFLEAHSNSGSQNSTNFVFDSNVGWLVNHTSAYQSWMWKRGAGFDVVEYRGNNVAGRQIPHSLNKTPEMIWIKNRDSGYDWQVWHKDLTSGKHLILNSNGAETNSNSPGLGSVSATHFGVGSYVGVNGNNTNYIAILFASVNGISKVGGYTGNGSTSGHQITLGFQPRFLIVKDASQTGNWNVFDTTRGFTGSNDKIMKLNTTEESKNVGGFATPNSTGFNIITDSVGNNNGINYIYYAHA